MVTADMWMSAGSKSTASRLSGMPPHRAYGSRARADTVFSAELPQALDRSVERLHQFACPRPPRTRQVDRLASVERQLQHAHVVDYLTDTRAPRFHQSGIRLNLDLLGNLAHFEARVDHRIAIHLQHDSGLHISAEPRQSRFEPVWADRQIRQYVGAGLVGH